VKKKTQLAIYIRPVMLTPHMTLGGETSNMFSIFTPKIGEDGTHFDGSHIFFGWVGVPQPPV